MKNYTYPSLEPFRFCHVPPAPPPPSLRLPHMGEAWGWSQQHPRSTRNRIKNVL